MKHGYGFIIGAGVAVIAHIRKKNKEKKIEEAMKALRFQKELLDDNGRRTDGTICLLDAFR